MIVCVVGPTGVGKTQLSETLAVRYDAVVVNCDSMQVYREMNIGTAKITSKENMGQPHELFDIVEPDETYTVYDYQKDLRRVLSKYKERNIVIVGGTGLYLKAGLFNYEFAEREKVDFENYSNEELYEMLKLRNDLEGIHINNRRRMISRLNSSGNNNLKNELLYENVYFIGLTAPREVLYEKLDARVDEMLKAGLLEEVENLYKKYGLTKAIKTGISYKEIVAYLKGTMTLEEAVRYLKQQNRNYAKRQYTWFNHQIDVKWFNVNYENFNETIEEVVKYIDELG